MADLLAALGAEKFLSLTTFKRSGAAVATPMWVAVDDGRLAFWTPVDSWKVKRARRDPRVTVAPCSRLGAVAAEPVAGTAVVRDDEATVRRVRDAVKRKYGLAFILITLLERVARRGREQRAAVLVALD
ncbi:PPOX class F420-dependent oxidoreductase [Mycobacterium sp. PS03-16]|uniref:PPOX class F420-dependent oxidoreductase n=1 Tax=Mycobacterium sp. PS03-16 TaxID=2559611 RepID=UPI0010741399|nr:PPOX class F420-dependent oxidoreductase [Mycobacterium sp. PS03-16]TFV58271.1 PPOX class F420-dependent oxidoreductase [Mycobacterium sp. PS03-16]